MGSPEAMREQALRAARSSVALAAAMIELALDEGGTAADRRAATTAAAQSIERAYAALERAVTAWVPR
jgi:hypothetical protein